MTRDESAQAVSKYVSTAWPVSSLTANGAWRAAWAQSHIPNTGLELFRELVAKEGFTPRQFGEIWLIQFPGPNKKLAAGFLKCEGL